jgi:hypothetical protein
MDLKEIKCEGVTEFSWLGVGLVNMLMEQGATKSRIFLDHLSDWLALYFQASDKTSHE